MPARFGVGVLVDTHGQPLPTPPPTPSPPPPVPYGFVNTSSWVGAEYTPARASDQLWWHRYDEFEADIERELRAARHHLGFRALRMFVHPLVWESDGRRLLERMARFAAVAHSFGMGTGWVLFDDCWAHAGASLEPSQACVVDAHPEQCAGGCCDGTFAQGKCCMNCWVAAPQDVARTSVARFEPYVRSIVRAFKDDPRVLWFEVRRGMGAAIGAAIGAATSAVMGVRVPKLCLSYA